MTVEKIEDFNKSQRTRLLEAADEFAGHTSLGGIPFIRDGHRFWYKMFWTVVFIGACAGGAYNLSDNIRRYLRYEYDTKVTLTYDYLDFPSVTVCNINPVRLSAIAQYGTDNMKYFFGQLTPSQQYTWDYNQQISTTSTKAPNKSRKRKRRKVRVQSIKSKYHGISSFKQTTYQNLHYN